MNMSSRPGATAAPLQRSSASTILRATVNTPPHSSICALSIMFLRALLCSMAILASVASALTRSDVQRASNLIRKAAGAPGSAQFANFAPKLLQLWFHDAVTFGAATNGGSNGCVNPLQLPNIPLIGVYATIKAIQISMGGVISKADLIVLGTATVVMDALPPSGPRGMDLLGNMTVGRKDQLICDILNALPAAGDGLDTVQNSMTNRLKLTKHETVALMGGHTLGRAHLLATGVNAGLDETPSTFDNNYFSTYLSKRWIRKSNILIGTYWTADDRSNTMRFNVDMSMAINTKTCQSNQGCPAPVEGTLDVIKQFAADAAEWHKHFQSAFFKTSSNGINGLIPIAQLSP